MIERAAVLVLDEVIILDFRPDTMFHACRYIGGHTPVSLEERIPWKCQRLVVGTGRYGSHPIMEEVKREARRRRVDLVILPTDEAIAALAKKPDETNAILHVTC